MLKEAVKLVNILIVNGSPRKNGNSFHMSEYVKKGASSVHEVNIHVYEFAGKNFSGCSGTCSAYCSRNGKCVIKDDLASFWEEYVWADGIVWVVPVYHAGPPGQVKCAMDRLCNMQWGYFNGRYPRWNKVIGACVQGATRWGGQELAIQWLAESALLMKCIPIAADPPKSYFGVAGDAGSWDKKGILEDCQSLELAENLGRRVAETAKIIQRGIQASPELEITYRPRAYMENYNKE